MNTTKIIIALPMSIIKCIEYYEKNGLIDKDKLFNSIIENQLDEILNTEIIEPKYSYNVEAIPLAVNLNRGTAEILGLFAARLGTTIAERLSGYLEYGLINTIIEIENLYFNSGGSNSAHKPPTSFNKESRECEQKGVK